MKNQIMLRCLSAATAVFCLTSPVVMAKEPQPMPGAPFKAKITPEMKKAAAFAVTTKAAETKQKIRLLEITEAQQQIVRGSNYIMTLRVEIDGKKQSVKTVVWHDIDNTMKLTSWEVVTDAAPKVAPAPKAPAAGLGAPH